MQAPQLLHALLRDFASQMHATRRTAVAASVMAVLRGRVLTVTGIGRSIVSAAKEKHTIKRADRLLSNPHLHAERERLYAALARGLIGHKARPTILIDWSDLDACKRYFLLRACVPVDGRALTLYEEVHTVKSKEKPKTHECFLQRLKTLLPDGCCPVLVTDAGFRTPWFKQVEAMGWHWVGRIRNRHDISLTQGNTWFPCKRLYAQATATPRALGCAQVTRRNPITCQLVIYQGKRQGRQLLTRFGQRARSAHSRKHAQAQREPWLLGTSLPAGFKFAQKVVKLYALRMQIEEAFRDLKSTRFGLGFEQHHARLVMGSTTLAGQRLQTILLLASLALLVAWLMGRATQLTGQHRGYQANTVRNRVVLSTIFIGLQTIDDSRLRLIPADIFAALYGLKSMIQNHGFNP